MKRVLIPLTLKEFQFIINALDAYLHVAEFSGLVAYTHLTRKGRCMLEDERVEARMFRAELFKRLKEADVRAGEERS